MDAYMAEWKKRSLVAVYIFTSCNDELQIDFES